jgi:hypothetical protein
MFHCNRYPSWFHIHVNFGVRANTDEVAAHGLDQYRHPAVATKTGGVSPAFWLLAVGFCCLDQRSSCSTLCCDWLASASAETAIDWRVDSAWRRTTLSRQRHPFVKVPPRTTTESRN